MLLRKVGLDDNGPLSALLLLGRDDRRVRRRDGSEGQERLVLEHLPAAAGPAHLRPDAVRAVGNNHCQPCVGCAKSCYDFNPRVAYLADLNDSDGY